MPTFDEFSEKGEPLLEREKQERLNELRRKQLAGEELTEEEMKELMRLQEEEDEAGRQKHGPLWRRGKE